MNRTEFYEGWTIFVFDVGKPGASDRLMMAFNSNRQIDFQGVVIDDEKAIGYAKQFIDSLENKARAEEDPADDILFASEVE